MEDSECWRYVGCNETGQSQFYNARKPCTTARGSGATIHKFTSHTADQFITVVAMRNRRSPSTPVLSLIAETISKTELVRQYEFRMSIIWQFVIGTNLSQTTSK